MTCKNCRIVQAPFDGIVLDPDRWTISVELCPLHEAAAELYRLLDLIVMEFTSDPMSVACFDLDAIVEPAKAIVEKVRRGK